MHLIREVQIGPGIRMYAIDNKVKLYLTVREALKAVGVKEAVVFWPNKSFLIRP